MISLNTNLVITQNLNMTLMPEEFVAKHCVKPCLHVGISIASFQQAFKSSCGTARHE